MRVNLKSTFHTTHMGDTKIYKTGFHLGKNLTERGVWGIKWVNFCLIDKQT